MDTDNSPPLDLRLRVSVDTSNSNQPTIQIDNVSRIDAGTTMYGRLKENEVFKDFKEFEAVLNEYISVIHVPFTSKNAATVDYHNRNKPRAYPVELKYTRITYRCKHFGTHEACGTGRNSTRSVHLLIFAVAVWRGCSPLRRSVLTNIFVKLQFRRSI